MSAAPARALSDYLDYTVDVLPGPWLHDVDCMGPMYCLMYCPMYCNREDQDTTHHSFAAQSLCFTRLIPVSSLLVFSFSEVQCYPSSRRNPLWMSVFGAHHPYAHVYGGSSSSWELDPSTCRVLSGSNTCNRPCFCFQLISSDHSGIFCRFSIEFAPVPFLTTRPEHLQVSCHRSTYLRTGSLQSPRTVELPDTFASSTRHTSRHG